MPPADPTTERLLVELVRARRTGDEPAVRRLWGRLVERELPRVRNLVTVYTAEGLPNGRIPPSAVDDVVAEAFLRLHKATFRGDHVGELRNFVRTATTFACTDHVRAHVRDDARRAGSLDEPHDGDDGDDGPVAVAAATRRRDLDDPARSVVDGGHLRSALDRVDPDKREVLLLQLAGHTGQEIAERLGLSVENVHQRLSRGRRQLRAALEGGPG